LLRAGKVLRWRDEMTQREHTVTKETLDGNRAVVMAFVDRLYIQRDVRGAFETYVSQDYIQHNPALGDGRSAAIAFLVPLFSSPDARFDVKRVLVDGDFALVHLHGRLDASGPGVAVMDLYRLEQCSIVEHWDTIQPVALSEANSHPFF